MAGHCEIRTSKYTSAKTLMCVELVDGELPLDSDVYNGHFYGMEITSSLNLTKIPTAAFGQSLTFDRLTIATHPHLKEIDTDFLGK